MMNKLKHLETKIKNIQNNVAAENKNLIHPAIVTKDEIDNFNIDF